MKEEKESLYFFMILSRCTSVNGGVLLANQNVSRVFLKEQEKKKKKPPGLSLKG